MCPLLPHLFPAPNFVPVIETEMKRTMNVIKRRVVFYSAIGSFFLPLPLLLHRMALHSLSQGRYVVGQKKCGQGVFLVFLSKKK